MRVMPAMASASSVAVTSARTSPRAADVARHSARPPAKIPANRSSSAEVQGRVCRHLADQPRQGRPGGRCGQESHCAADHLAQVLGQRPGVGKLGRGADREHRLVHEVRLARPAPVDRGLAGAGALGDRGDRQAGITRLGEQFDRGAQHRSVNSRIAGSAKVYHHYETQSNISRRDRCSRLDDLAQPQFSPDAQQILDMMATMAARVPVGRRRRCTRRPVPTPASTISARTTTENDSTSTSPRCARSTGCTTPGWSTSTGSCCSCSRTGCC